jgi:hypothetical protein
MDKPTPPEAGGNVPNAIDALSKAHGEKGAFIRQLESHSVLITEIAKYGEAMAAWGAAQEREKMAAELAFVLADWNALVAAIDSKTNGGAIGHARALVAELAACKTEAERYRKGHERYATARTMSSQQWKDAWMLSANTGKPFDEIIDDLKPFFAIDKARKA